MAAVAGMIRQCGLWVTASQGTAWKSLNLSLNLSITVMVNMLRDVFMCAFLLKFPANHASFKTELEKEAGGAQLASRFTKTTHEIHKYLGIECPPSENSRRGRPRPARNKEHQEKSMSWEDFRKLLDVFLATRYLASSA